MVDINEQLSPADLKGRTPDTPQSFNGPPNLETDSGPSRRDFFAVLRNAGVIAGAAVIGVTSMGVRAEAKEAVADGAVAVPVEGEVAVKPRAEQAREAAYARVKAEGLRRIGNREGYTLRLDNEFGYDVLAVRFKGDKSAIFVHYFSSDGKVLEKKRAEVKEYESLLEHYMNRGFTVSALD